MHLSDATRHKLLTPPEGRVRVVMDSDTFNDIDDQFAIVQMMLSPERLKVEAIYAAPFKRDLVESPGQGMALSYAEILRVLERLAVPHESLVHKGVTDFVGPEKQAREAAAVDDLIDRARAGSSDDPLYVIAIAAISNVASAILKAPDILDRIVVVWLGGHVLSWPHTREFNLAQDVGGAEVLLDSGVPLVLVPCMGVTSHLHTSVPEIERYVEPLGELGAFLAMRFKEYSPDHKLWSKQIWDMAAVAWLLNPAWAPSALVPSPRLGAEITWEIDPSRHPIRCVTELHRDPILRDFVTKLEAFVA